MSPLVLLVALALCGAYLIGFAVAGTWFPESSEDVAGESRG